MKNKPKKIKLKDLEIGKDELSKGLRAIYIEDNGKMPNLKTVQKVKRSKYAKFLAWASVVVILTSIAAWLGFIVLMPYDSGDGKNLALEIEGPEQITVGEDLLYSIKYKNTGRVPIAALEIKLNIPEALIVEEFRPSPTDGDKKNWMIGPMSRGSDGVIELRGYFLSAVPNDSTLQAIVAYRPANFNADFQDIVTKKIIVEKGALDITIDGPQKASTSDKIEYAINVINITKKEIKNCEIQAKIPTSFTVASAEPAFADGTSSWKIESLPAEGSVALKLVGSFNVDATGNQTIEAVAGLFNADNDFLSQKNAVAQTEVTQSGFSARLIINGSSQNQNINLGENAHASIDFVNNGTEKIYNAKIELILSGALELPIDWQGAQLSGGVKNRNEIVWSAQTTPALIEISPKGEGSIDVVLPILAEFDMSKTSDSFSLALESTFEKIGSATNSKTFTSSTITIGVNTDFTFTPIARYFDNNGAQIGSGPLPPKSGVATKYRYYWLIQNSMHDFTDATITMKIPSYIKFEGNEKTDAGTLKFNSETNEVKWTIDEGKATKKEFIAEFDLSVTPTADDIGKTIKLSEAGVALATDAETKGLIKLDFEPMNTDLQDDPLATGKGEVVE